MDKDESIVVAKKIQQCLKLDKKALKTIAKTAVVGIIPSIDELSKERKKEIINSMTSKIIMNEQNIELLLLQHVMQGHEISNIDVHNRNLFIECIEFCLMHHFYRAKERKPAGSEQQNSYYILRTIFSAIDAKHSSSYTGITCVNTDTVSPEGTISSSCTNITKSNESSLQQKSTGLKRKQDNDDYDNENNDGTIKVRVAKKARVQKPYLITSTTSRFPEIPKNGGISNTKISNTKFITIQHQQKKQKGKEEDDHHYYERCNTARHGESIGFSWNKFNDKWMAAYNMLDDFRKVNGHCNVPYSYMQSNTNLGKWVNTQRYGFTRLKDGKKSQLTQERIDLLDSIGFSWKQFEDQWMAKYKMLDDFRNANGHCKVPCSYIQSNIRLGAWVSSQRSQFKRLKDGNKSELTQGRIDLLNSIGFLWIRLNDQWMATYKMLDDFRKVYGHCNVPRSYIQSNKKLGVWVIIQRSRLKRLKDGKRSKITQERINLLDSIGFSWSRFNNQWMATYKMLDDFRKANGHCKVPNSYIQSNIRLGVWVRSQRCHFKRLKDGKTSELTQERINLLDSIDFSWNQFNDKWMATYKMLDDFRKVYGHCNVPCSYTQSNTELGTWVRSQRSQFKRLKDGKTSELTQERMNLLDSIGFSWSRFNDQWMATYKMLDDFRKVNGHCNVPQLYIHSNTKLGVWVRNQRSRFKRFKDGKKSELTQERFDLLDSIGLFVEST